MNAALVASVAPVAELDALAGEWDELAERTGASPFLRAGWIAAWWSAFGPRHGQLEIRIVRRGDGRLVALLPVRRERGTLGSPTNWHSPEFGLLSESDEATARLLHDLFQERPRRVSLAFLPPVQAGLLGQEAASRGYRVIQRTLQRSPHVPIDGDWPAYERSLGKNLRGDLGRRRRLLSGRGVVSLEVSSGDRLEELLAQGFEVESSGWKGERGTAMRSHTASRRFYSEVARWAAERGWLRLAFLRLDGRAMAFDFCLEHAGIHYMLKTGYDPAQAELSPGKLLRHAMLARAFREGLKSYEMLGAAEPWKLQWTRSTRSRQLLQGFRPSPLGLLDWSLFRHGRPLVRWTRDLVSGRMRRPSEELAAHAPGEV